MRIFTGPAVLALVLTVSLTACGGSGDAGATGASASPGTAAAEVTSATDGSTSSPACEPATEEIQAKTKAGGYDTTVEVADCVATVKTSLTSLAADGEKAMAICVLASNEAFSHGISVVNVVSSDGTTLANDKLGMCQPG